MTPSIDISLTIESPTVGAEPVLVAADVAQAGFRPQPSPEAVARFQAAMAEPLSENARMGRQLADAVSLTQTSFGTARAILPSEAPVVSPSAAEPLAVVAETALPSVEGANKSAVPVIQVAEQTVVAQPKINDAVKSVAELPRAVVEPLPVVDGKPMREVSPAIVVPEVSTSTVPVAPTATVVSVVPTATVVTVAPTATVVPEVSAAAVPEVPAATVSVAPATQVVSEASATQVVSEGSAVPVSDVRGKPVVDVSLPPSIARISVVVSGEIVRDVVAVDQPLETSQGVEGERVKGAGVRGAVIREALASVAENSSTKPGSVETVEVPVRTGTTSRTGTTEESVQVDAARTTADFPDAERLVAAGVSPMVVGVQGEPEIVPVRETEAVAPIAALSAKDRVVRTDVLVEAATAVADTLLVTPGLMRGEGEILVQLKPDVLEGSQIRISVQGKTLDVAFQTPTEQLMQMLTTRLPELQQHLVAALPAFSFKVNVAWSAGLGRGIGRKGTV